jgi:dipeptidyl aminopeptidase/acylaminoacyl peptidase
MFLENISDYRRAHREAEYGCLVHDRVFLKDVSPIQRVERITAPLMVIHGTNDPRVPLSEAEQVVQALRAQGTPVEPLVFDDEGHGRVRLHDKRVAYPQVVTFLERYVMGDWVATNHRWPVSTVRTLADGSAERNIATKHHASG